jgi:hypothetical protein
MKLSIALLRNILILVSVACLASFLAISKTVHPLIRVSEPEVINDQGISAFIETHLSRNQIQRTAAGDICVAFAGLRNGERETEIFFRKWDADKRTWGRLLALSDGETNRGASLWISSLGILHLAWTHHVTDGDKIYVAYRKSADKGETWSDVRLFEAGHSVARYPTVIGDETRNVYIHTINGPSGKPENLLFFTSNDDGDTWKRIDVIREENPEASPSDARLVAGDKGRAYLIWLDPSRGGRSVVFSKSKDGGRAWSDPIVLNDEPSAVLSEPQLLRQGNLLYAAWAENRGDENLLYFDYSVDEGDTWHEDQVVYNKRVMFVTPKMMTVGNNILLSWSDYRDQIGEKGERLLYNLHGPKRGWLQADAEGNLPEIGTAANLKKFRGFSLASFEKNGAAVAFSEKLPEKRAQVYFTLSKEMSLGFAAPSQVSRAKSGVDAVSPHLCKVSETEYAVLYNEAPAQLYMGQPKKWLGNLVLTRIRARLK